MDAFIPDSVKLILLVLIATVLVLSRVARAFPAVAWLQLFRLPVIPMSEEQRARRRRIGNRMAALEMVLAGLALPPLYFLSTVMFFSEPSLIPTIIAFAGSFVCISLGVWVFVRNR
jgi:hypothetical protein